MLDRLHEHSVEMKKLEVIYKNKISDLEYDLEKTKDMLFNMKLIFFLTLFVFISMMYFLNSDKETIIKCISKGNSEKYCREIVEREL